MSSRPDTGPVVLPPNPKAVADGQVAGLAGLGVTHKPPTAREYEHAALGVALQGGSLEEVYSVLAHLDARALRDFGEALDWLSVAISARLREIVGPDGG